MGVQTEIVRDVLAKVMNVRMDIKSCSNGQTEFFWAITLKGKTFYRGSYPSP